MFSFDLSYAIEYGIAWLAFAGWMVFVSFLSNSVVVGLAVAVVVIGL